MECAAPGAHLDFFKRHSVIAQCTRLFTCASTSLRGQHAFARTEKQRRRARGQSAATSRQLAKNCRPLARASGSWEDQKFFHARGALSFAQFDAEKPRTFERN